MLTQLRKRIGSTSEYRKNVLTLMTGTFVAQLIPVLIAPILTRIYSPEDFGIYTLVLSIVSFGAILATARYEVAIMLPEREEDAFAIFVLSIIINLIFSLSLWAMILLMGKKIEELIGIDNYHWLYLVPLLIFLTAAYQSVNYWINRRKMFKVMATNRVGKSIILGGSQVSLGILGYSIGLVWGMLISLISSLFFLARFLKKPVLFEKKNVRIVGSRYIKFPKYSLLADGINSFSNQIPVFFLLKYFSTQATGYFGLTLRILGLPITLIANAALDVFKQRASDDYIRYGNCRQIYLKTLKGLLYFSIPTFTTLFIFSPIIFSVVFGEEWRKAGEYARIMSIMFCFKFIASPLSYVLYIAEKQQFDLIWQICLMICTIISFTIGFYYNNDIIGVWCFSLSYSALYAVYIFISYRLSKE